MCPSCSKVAEFVPRIARVNLGIVIEALLARNSRQPLASPPRQVKKRASLYQNVSSQIESGPEITRSNAASLSHHDRSALLYPDGVRRVVQEYLAYKKLQPL